MIGGGRRRNSVVIHSDGVLSYNVRIVEFVPEGQSTVAQRFIAGDTNAPVKCVRPVGTVETMVRRHVQTSLRDEGILSTIRIPAMNRWAIVKCPSGASNTTAVIDLPVHSRLVPGGVRHGNAQRVQRVRHARATWSTWRWASSSAGRSARSSRRWSMTSSCRRSACCWAASISRSSAITLSERTADAEAVTINYGLFINTVLDFVIVAACIFMVIKAMNRLAQGRAAEGADDEGLPEVLHHHSDSRRPAARIARRKCPRDNGQENVREAHSTQAWR